MNTSRSTRGQPLIFLGAVLGLWVAVRVVLFDAALVPTALEIPRAGATSERPYGLAGDGRTAARRSAKLVHREQVVSADTPSAHRDPPPSHFYVRPTNAPWAGPLPQQRDSLKWQAMPQQQDQAAARPLPVQSAAAHQIMWMAALSRMPMPRAEERQAFAPSAPFYAAGRQPAARRWRWSGDAWLFLRRGGDRRFAGGASTATYGASQAGAVVRYRLNESSAHKPAAYLRASTALSAGDDREAAAGFSARPVSAIPLRAAAELRVSDQAGEMRLRPAAMVVTEVQPFDLPARARGEFYAQAGYVGGKFATAFVDGQLRADREAVSLGKASLRAGGGVWGGAQTGASRLDIGPTATVTVGLGESSAARIAVDWRLRVAGDARPGPGPALTISAGF